MTSVSKFILAFVSTGLALPAAAPPVSNRAPVEMEIGYLPADGSNVRTNPPALAWLPEPGADVCAVQLARDQAFARGVINVLRTPYVLCTHTAQIEELKARPAFPKK